MKFISRTRPNFCLPDYLAYCSVAAAVRHIRRAPHFAVGLVISQSADIDTYYRAAHAVLKPGDGRRNSDVRTLPIIFKDAQPQTSHSNAIEALENDKVIILFEREDSIPPDIRVALDLVVRIGIPTPEQARGVMRWVYRTEISGLQAKELLAHDWERLRHVVRPGRPISRVLSTLTNHNTTVASGLSESDGSELFLQNMAGYGEARDWGLELATDIHDLKAGLIEWNDVDKGLLLSGPPGTGKTIYADALARTCGVPVVHGSASQWQARGHLGDFLKAMRASFAEAKKLAPAILFIDELDSFGDRNDESNNQSYDTKAINGLLECLDGSQDRDGVVVVAACNFPDRIDGAILRSGRLDRHIRIELPNAEAREAILRIHLRGELALEDITEFALASVGATGADIARLIRDARRLARRKKRSMLQQDLRAVMPKSEVIPRENLYANAVHEIGHAIAGVALGLELRHVEISPVIRLTSDVQGLGGACFASRPWERRTRQHYLDMIAVYVAGSVAEDIFLGSHDDGWAIGKASDLQRATRLAIDMEFVLGLGEHLFAHSSDINRGMAEFRDVDQSTMLRADRILREQVARAHEIIERHREASVKLHGELLEHSGLSGERVLAVVEEAMK